MMFVCVISSKKKKKKEKEREDKKAARVVFLKLGSDTLTLKHRISVFAKSEEMTILTL